MTFSPVDQFEQDLIRRIEVDGPVFERKFGKNMRVFLELLPGVFHVLRRSALDVEAPAAARGLAAVASFYIVELNDFLQEPSAGVSGWIDDIWVAYVALARIAEDIPDERLAQHWRHHDQPFEEARALADNAVALRQHVPPRVLGLLDRFLQ